MSGGRRGQRRAAVFLLYQRDLTAADVDELYDGYERDNGVPAGEFVRARVEGVWDDRDRLDAEIDASAQGWTSDRMAPLERSILRLAVWELLRADVPPAVAIDEAVALAKRYASPEAASLVNGVLGSVARRQGVGR
ncbi:MAG TPA: transcription antitermination factor NusB [Gaiellales bacterium]|nr:transcription antitermination factor NusB [Gaiellales bacterium]